MRRSRTICIAFAVLAGAAVAVSAAQQEKPHSSCRSSEIYGGQHDTGAVIDMTPGNPNPLRFFRLNKNRPGIDVISPLDSSFLADYAKERPWPYHPDRLPFHFYWSSSDDFLAWVDHRIWLWRSETLFAGVRPRFENVQHSLTGYFYSLDDVVPEHIGDIARLPGHDPRRYLLEFNLRSRIFQQLPISTRLPTAGLAWTSNDNFLRVRPQFVDANRFLDIFDPKSGQWTEFSPQRLPLDAKLLMFRLSPRDKKPEALIAWRDRANVDYIGSVTQGASAPKVLDSGQFEHIHVSPDRTQLLGVTERSGRFHRLKGEPYTPRVSFWLDRFETTKGLEKFYLQENATYAFVKINDPIAGTEIAVWQREGDQVEPIGTICSQPIDPAADKRKPSGVR